MPNATLPRKYRYIGITDERVECDRCGKVDLRSTVVLAELDDDGNDQGITYYGSSCAARALGVRGGGRAVLLSARQAHLDTLTAAADARAMLAYYGLPETGDVDEETLSAATTEYAACHASASWSSKQTPADWRTMVLAMIDRKRAALAAARALSDVRRTVGA